MAGMVEVDRPRCGWRQIELTSVDKGTAIIDPHRDASIVADTDQRPKRKRTVRRRHCGTVEALAARGEMTTQAVSVAVDTGLFGARRCASEQRERNNSNFGLAQSPPPHWRTNDHDRPKRVLRARDGVGAKGRVLESVPPPLTLSRVAFGNCIQ